MAHSALVLSVFSPHGNALKTFLSPHRLQNVIIILHFRFLCLQKGLHAYTVQRIWSDLYFK